MKYSFFHFSDTMHRSPRQETSTRKKKYEHSPSDDEKKSSRNYKNFKHSGMLITKNSLVRIRNVSLL